MTLSVGVYLLGQPVFMGLLQARSIRLRWSYKIGPKSGS